MYTLESFEQRTDYTKVFNEAVQALREDVEAGRTFEWSLEHYADLFGVDKETLRNEYYLAR